MAWKMTFPGGLNLDKQLRALPEVLAKEIILEALVKAGEPIRQRMAELAPRGPEAPHLAESMTINALTQSRANKDADTDFAVAIGPAKDFFYGSFWEFGWKGHPQAHPFARPAFDEQAEKALQIIGQQLWAAFRKASVSGTGGV